MCAALTTLPLVPSGRLDDSVRLYQEALSIARQAGDKDAVEQLLDGLKEVKKRREQQDNK